MEAVAKDVLFGPFLTYINKVSKKYVLTTILLHCYISLISAKQYIFSRLFVKSQFLTAVNFVNGSYCFSLTVFFWEKTDCFCFPNCNVENDAFSSVQLWLSKLGETSAYGRHNLSPWLEQC